MHNIKKSIFKTKVDEDMPIGTLSISSTNIDPETGAVSVVIGGGEPNEIIGLSFQMTAISGFSQLNFFSPISVAQLNLSNLYREGIMTLPLSGGDTAGGGYTPASSTTSCIVTIISRSSGLTYGIGFSTTISPE